MAWSHMCFYLLLCTMVSGGVNIGGTAWTIYTHLYPSYIDMIYIYIYVCIPYICGFLFLCIGFIKHGSHRSQTKNEVISVAAAGCAAEARLIPYQAGRRWEVQVLHPVVWWNNICWWTWPVAVKPHHRKDQWRLKLINVFWARTFCVRSWRAGVNWRDDLKCPFSMILAILTPFSLPESRVSAPVDSAQVKVGPVNSTGWGLWWF